MYLFSDFQELIATAIGFGVAPTFLVDITIRSDQKLQNLSKSIIKNNKHLHKKYKRNIIECFVDFNQRCSRLRSRSKFVVGIAILTALPLSVLLVCSVFWGKVQLSPIWAFAIGTLCTVPMVCGWGYGVVWYWNGKRLRKQYNLASQYLNTFKDFSR